MINKKFDRYPETGRLASGRADCLQSQRLKPLFSACRKGCTQMRNTVFLLFVFGLAGSLQAADPLIGTWKLNVTKSEMPSPEVAMEELTEIYREIEGDQIEFTRKGTQTNGTAISSIWTWPQQGGMVKRRHPSPLPADRAYVQTVVEPGNWYVTVLQNGKQIAVRHKAFSKDGKIMTQIYMGMGAQGKPIVEVLVFDRQ